jgi:biotin transporter BioY
MLPTLAFENNKQAIMYLVGFAFGTIISMVIFSFLLGLLSKYASRKRKDTILIVMNSIAGLAAIIIGILWIWKTW